MPFYVKMFESAIKDWDNTYDGKNKKKAIKSKIINNYQVSAKQTPAKKDENKKAKTEKSKAKTSKNSAKTSKKQNKKA